MTVVVIEPPEPLLTAEDVRAHLRITGDGDDDMLDALIAAATAVLDGPTGTLGRALGLQTLELQRPDFPCAGGWIALPCRPIVGVEQVLYEDATGNDLELDEAAWKWRGNVLAPAIGMTWPATSGEVGNVRIQYRAGYEPELLPANVIYALKLMVGEYYSMARADLLLKKEVVEGVGSQEWDLTGALGTATQAAVSRLLHSLQVLT